MENLRCAIQYTFIDCYRCGMMFSIPEVFVERRKEDHRDFYCPNGHKMHYHVADKPSLEERQTQILKLHEQEQAEAREQARPGTQQAGESQAKQPSMAEIIMATPCVCPHCHAKYKCWSKLGDHLRRKHDVDRKEFEVALYVRQTYGTEP